MLSEERIAYNEFGVISFPEGNLSQADAHCFSIRQLYAAYDNSKCPPQPELKVMFRAVSPSIQTLDIIGAGKTRTLCDKCHFVTYDPSSESMMFLVQFSSGSTAIKTSGTSSGVAFSPSLSPDCQCPPDQTQCGTGERHVTFGGCKVDGQPTCTYEGCQPCFTDPCNQATCASWGDECTCNQRRNPCPTGSISQNINGTCSCVPCAGPCTKWDTSQNTCNCSGCALTCQPPKSKLNSDLCQCECPSYPNCPYGFNSSECKCNTCELDCTPPLKPNAQCSLCQCIAADGQPTEDPSQCADPNRNCFIAQDMSDSTRTCEQSNDGDWCCYCKYSGMQDGIMCCKEKQIFIAPNQCACPSEDTCTSMNGDTMSGCTMDANTCECVGCVCSNGGTPPDCECPEGTVQLPDGSCGPACPPEDGSQCSDSCPCAGGENCVDGSCVCVKCPDGSCADGNGACPNNCGPNETNCYGECCPEGRSFCGNPAGSSNCCKQQCVFGCNMYGDCLNGVCPNGCLSNGNSCLAELRCNNAGAQACSNDDGCPPGVRCICRVL